MWLLPVKQMWKVETAVSSLPGWWVTAMHSLSTTGCLQLFYLVLDILNMSPSKDYIDLSSPIPRTHRCKISSPSRRKFTPHTVFCTSSCPPDRSLASVSQAWGDRCMSWGMMQNSCLPHLTWPLFTVFSLRQLHHSWPQYIHTKF